MAIPGKQAVVVIHGMGEQFPMTTIRDFVDSVWKHDDDVLDSIAFGDAANDIWSKPDASTGSLELRRITTRPSRASPLFPAGVRTDFYECYWADLTENTSWSHFKDWFLTIIWRRPRRVPKKVAIIFCALWLFTIVVGGIWLASALRMPVDAHIGKLVFWDWFPLMLVRHWLGWELAFASLIVGSILALFVVPYFGDVARYVRPAPANIGIRRDVRARALKLLNGLHDDHSYDRIVIAAHSLGSIIAYDLVTFLWAERLDQLKLTETANAAALAALREVERLGAEIRAAPGPIDKSLRTTFRAAQRDFGRELAKLKLPNEKGVLLPVWLISDLVTFGSALTHAEFLLAYDRKELERRIEERGFPVCPPVTEPANDDAQRLLDAAQVRTYNNAEGKSELVSYLDGDSASGVWKIHHAAPFAATRWTNLYDPPMAVLIGDPISGPLAPIFGQGLKDKKVRIVARKPIWLPRVFTHTGYWTEKPGHQGPPSEHIEELRKAVDLLAER